MNNKIRKLLIRGFRHRGKEVTRVCAAAMLAVFFISGILLFQENMYQWQMAENRKQFGDWFAMETYQQTKGFVDNKYLTKEMRAAKYVMIYDKSWNPIGVNAGFMSQEFFDKGNLTLAAGSLPAGDNEIACDYVTLSKLGVEAKLGTEITFNYYSGNNSSSSVNPKRTATYTLCGILENFTDSWTVSRYIAGAILSEEGCKSLDAEANNVYMYGLKDSIRVTDYQPIYDELSAYNSKKIYYNTSVYDFKPWGPKNIYNYIYMLTMVIGVASLTYQIISYQKQRDDNYQKMYLLGSTKTTIFRARSLENIVLVIPSGLLGAGGAVLAGRLLGWYLEVKKGTAFYQVTPEVLLKSGAALLAGFVAAEIVIAIMVYTFKTDYAGSRIRRVGAGRNKKNKTKAAQSEAEKSGQQESSKTTESAGQQDSLEKTGFKGQQESSRKTRKSEKQESSAQTEIPGKLTKKNVTWQLHVRLSRSAGIGLRIGARVLALLVFIVILFCGYNIYSALKVYRDVANKADITGFQAQDSEIHNTLSLSYDTTNSTTSDASKKSVEDYLAYERSKLSLAEYIELKEQIQTAREQHEPLNTHVGIMDIGITNRYCKYGNSSIINGIDESLKERIASVKGIENLTYSGYDSSRFWDWDNMSLKALGISRLSSTGAKLGGYCEKYLFATEYVEPTEQLYQRLSKYIDASRVDYNAFKEGRQVIVILDKSANQAYDQTMQAGVNINFHYYTLPINAPLANSVQYQEKAGQATEPPFPYWNRFIELAKGKYYDDVPSTSGKNSISAYMDTEYTKTSEYYEIEYKMEYEPCVSANVAAVVQLTDEVKEDLADVLPNYGYYTAIASSNLGIQACAKQNELMKEALGDRYSDDVACTFAYNQITATYNLAASYSATDNILSSYFSANNVIYKSCASNKEELRTGALDAILQYGLTMIAAMVIHILVYAIINKNRLEAERKKLQLLLRLGAGKSKIRRICMIEVLRESLWCIVTLPLQFIVQYYIIMRVVQKL